MIETGLMHLLNEIPKQLRDRRVGLATHAPAVTPDLTDAIEALGAAGVKLTALYGPEHGLAGAAADGAAVGHATHARTGLPIFSLYGATKEPTPEMLADVDVVLFDMQDVGVRFYTYLSTLWHLLKGASKAGKPVWVLDRPNPLNGMTLEGPLVAPGFESFVGVVPVPIRHGMTLGELALWMNDKGAFGAPAPGADLTVMQLRGWRREQWFEQTGLPWVITSPAMPHLSTVTVYPGMCFLEGTNVSGGRGTALPFEICGAPWMDGTELAQQLNALQLPGVRFRPHTFTPTADKHANQVCSGIQVHVVNREALRPVSMGLHVLAACQSVAPDHGRSNAFAFLRSSWEGRPAHLDLLAGSAQVREALMSGVPVEDLVAGWESDLAAFAEQRRPYLLYT
ncbi:MAG: hypothetical protein BWY63_01132 [Chloroflexi bacterium ADurb.Bin360]|nr:MAG: hypothetical protein BWY63_01132 [Chloroflexi bacterium ADurb.Bin360]